MVPQVDIKMILVIMQAPVVETPCCAPGPRSPSAHNSSASIAKPFQIRVIGMN